MNRNLRFAARATDLIVTACRLAPRPTVLLPALFCSEVAEAIEAAGMSYRCYDVTTDLSPNLPLPVQDAGAVVTLHPFGLLRRLRKRPVPDDVVWVEDACHALRSFRADDEHAVSDLVVYSPRKELGWADGGIAAGPLGRRLTGDVRSRALKQQWRTTKLDDDRRQGILVTERARAALGTYLPRSANEDVLYVLPLLSAERDVLIGRLRNRGWEAWYWKGILTGMGPETTPGSWWLRERLCLVPLPRSTGPQLTRLLSAVSEEPLESWPGWT